MSGPFKSLNFYVVKHIELAATAVQRHHDARAVDDISEL